MLRGEAWFEEMLQGVAAAERRGNSDQARNDRADGQHLKRERHRPRRLARPVPGPVPVAAAMIVESGVVRFRRAVRYLVVLLMRVAVRMRVGGIG